MRTIVLSAILFFAAEVGTPYASISKLASYLSDGDSIGALESFDKQSKDYPAIERSLAALAAQNEVLCSIDIVEDKEADDAKAEIHHLDLDWYMQLKSRAGSGPLERRRERVAVTLRKVGQNWRITSLMPQQILSPATVH